MQTTNQNQQWATLREQMAAPDIEREGVEGRGEDAIGSDGEWRKRDFFHILGFKNI